MAARWALAAPAIIWLALALLATAQSPQLPACASEDKRLGNACIQVVGAKCTGQTLVPSCFSSSLEGARCNATAPNCFCGSPTFLLEFGACIPTYCNLTEVASAQSALQSICASATSVVSTTTTPASIPPTSTTSEPTNISPAPEGLNTGAKVAIALGVILSVVLVLLGAAAVAFRRRTKENKWTEDSTAKISELGPAPLRVQEMDGAARSELDASPQWVK